MIVYVDIDGTICTQEIDYNYAKPLYNRIKYINKLYDKKHTIILWTARGTVTGINWRKITETQLKEWGVKYHKLMFKKPYYDLFIDDRVMNASDIDESK